MIPVPFWLFIAFMVLAGLGWLYEVSVIKPRQRRARQQRREALYDSTEETY